MTTAIILLVLALVLQAIEFVVVSWGLLTAAAIGCAIGSVISAFAVSQGAGWTFLAATVVGGILVVNWGVRFMLRSRAVRGAEIIEDAGYARSLDGSGLAPGIEGELTTDAYPSGRARFAPAGHPPREIDVRLDAGSAERGARVVLRRLDGASATVSIIPAPTSQG